VENRSYKIGLLGALFLLTALVACVLNLDRLMIGEIQLFARIAIPILIFLGLIGTVQDRGPLSSAASVVYWVGIVFLFLVIFGTLVPRDWIFTPPNTPLPNRTFLVLRGLFLISVATFLVVLFRSLPKASYAGTTGANSVD
jgi:uncharacterized membrane protein